MKKWLIIFFIALILPAAGFKAASTATVSTTVTTTQSNLTLTQNAYRWYENTDNLTPTTALAGESAAATTPAAGTVLRLRINILASVLQLDAGARFKLQYAQNSTTSFTDIGTSTAWIFYDNSSVADGQLIVTTLLSDSNTGESYEESNPSAVTPNNIIASQKGEWDWVIKNNSANREDNWYFRMIYSSGTLLDSYLSYPTLNGTTAATSSSQTGSGGNIGFVGKKPVSPVSPPATSTPPPITPPSPCDNPALQKVDFSGDCKVDIIDLSILLFYYNQTGSEISRYDLNNNNIVDLADISVLMYYWTN